MVEFGAHGIHVGIAARQLPHCQFSSTTGNLDTQMTTRLLPPRIISARSPEPRINFYLTFVFRKVTLSVSCAHDTCRSPPAKREGPKQRKYTNHDTRRPFFFSPDAATGAKRSRDASPSARLRFGPQVLCRQRQRQRLTLCGRFACHFHFPQILVGPVLCLSPHEFFLTWQCTLYVMVGLSIHSLIHSSTWDRMELTVSCSERYPDSDITV